MPLQNSKYKLADPNCSLAIVTKGHLGKMQTLFEKVPRYLQHRSPSVDFTSNQLHERFEVSQATTSLETTRRANMEDKRRRRKNRDPFDINTEKTVTCSRCRKTCLSRIPTVRGHVICYLKLFCFILGLCFHMCLKRYLFFQTLVDSVRSH